MLVVGIRLIKTRIFSFGGLRINRCVELGLFVTVWTCPILKDSDIDYLPMAGVFIATGQVLLKKAGPLTEIKSIVEWYGNDLAKAKRAVGFVGSGVMVDNGNYAQYCINNLFRGGIKSLLSDSASTGETTVSHDEVKNKSVEVVSFENWEKY